MKLDDAHYKLVDQLEALVDPAATPSMLHATNITVKGPVKFAAGVSGGGPPIGPG